MSSISSEDKRFIYDSDKSGHYRLKLDSNTINRFVLGNGFSEDIFSESIGKIADEFEMFLDGPNLEFFDQEFEYHNIWISKKDEEKFEKMWAYIKKGGSQASPLRLALKFRIWNSMVLKFPLKPPHIYNSPLEVEPIARFPQSMIKRC